MAAGWGQNDDERKAEGGEKLRFEARQQTGTVSAKTARGRAALPAAEPPPIQFSVREVQARRRAAMSAGGPRERNCSP
eukprot:965403-Pyramimonas_sp.AAC.1